MLFDIGKAATARTGVGVGAGANRNQRDRSGMTLPQQFAGSTGPVAVHEVVAPFERRGMTGIAGQHGPQSAVQVSNGQHGNIVIDRTIRCDAETDDFPSFSTRRLAANPARP